MPDDKRSDVSRKTFLKKLGAASAVMAGVPFMGTSKSKESETLYRKPSVPVSYSANNQINIALIGAGLMGQGDMNTALEHDGVKAVAVCDLYNDRMIRCRERYGEYIFTSNDYREILGRSDVDAVIIATSDHWHERIASDALEAGKAVYLEKPMVQQLSEARRLIETEERTGLPLLVGSQRTSAITYEKARDLFQAGEIGKLNFVEAYWDRFSAIGAWQYSIPPNTGEHNVDWRTYREGMNRMPYNDKHFFRWRNYNDYGTGVAGDLFVHLFSGLHMIVGSNGPDTAMATGGLRHWQDGRDAEDVMLGLYNYPETDNHPAFTLSLRVNFADGSGGGSQIRLVGDEGEMELGRNRVVVRKKKLHEKPGYTVDNFSDDTQEKFLEAYRERYPEQRARIIEPSEFVYRAPDGYNDRYDHFMYFFDAIRNGTSLMQNSTYGLRACGPALLANISHREGRIIKWDPNQMKIV